MVQNQQEAVTATLPSFQFSRHIYMVSISNANDKFLQNKGTYMFVSYFENNKMYFNEA